MKRICKSLVLLCWAIYFWITRALIVCSVIRKYWKACLAWLHWWDLFPVLFTAIPLLLPLFQFFPLSLGLIHFSNHRALPRGFRGCYTRSTTTTTTATLRQTLKLSGLCHSITLALSLSLSLSLSLYLCFPFFLALSSIPGAALKVLNGA